MWQRSLEQYLARLEVWTAYIRAKMLSVRGAHVERRVAIYRNCKIDRPWGVTIGERTRLEQGVWLKLVDDEACLRFGTYTFIGARSQFDVKCQVEVGDHTLIAPGCFICDHHHGLGDAGLLIDQQPCLSRPIFIGSDVWLGVGVAVLSGVRIGDSAVVGAGAVVTRDVPPRAITVGVPARTIRFRS